jgi:hypothetical protein
MSTMLRSHQNTPNIQEQPLFDPKQENLPYTIAIIKPDTVLQTEKLNEILTFI